MPKPKRRKTEKKSPIFRAVTNSLANSLDIASGKSRGSDRAIDKSLLLLIFVLLLFGLIMIYNSTVVLSNQIYGNSYHFLLLQLSWVLVSLVGFLFFSRLEIEKLKKLSSLIFLVSLAFLLLLALFGILPCAVNFVMTPCINGANRWFYLNPEPFPRIPVLGVLGFQPSELSKFALILFLSAKIDKTLKEGGNPFKDLLIIGGLCAFLIILQPNLSTASLVAIIAASIYFASGASLKPVVLFSPVVALLGLVAMLGSDYRRQRVLTFLSGAGGSGVEELSTGYHIRQILIALGSGGIFGMGFGQSRQKFQYLPEIFADSIFAIIGEELGFFGTAILVLLFLALIFRGYLIAIRARDMFSKLLAVGVTTWVGLQFFVNVGAMTKLIPLTGVPLPLISYGGSSLFFMLLGLGVLANVSRQTNERKFL